MNDQSMQPIARRIMPADRKVEIPDGWKGLVVRANRPERLLSGGQQHKVRGWLQPTPELYLLPEEPVPLFLWLTDLHTGDGKAVNLSWKLEVRVRDPIQLWEQWLQFQEADDIPAPAAVISPRVEDPAQELVKRFGLEELRTDPDVRRQVGAKLSLLVKDELDHYGLEIARDMDYGRLRFQTDADVANAQVERETLARMVEDARLQTVINRLDNAETLAYRLREWLATHERTLSDATVDAIVQQSLAGDEQALVEALETAEETGDAPVDQATPAAVDLAGLNHHNGRWHIVHHLGQFVFLAGVLAALVLAAMAYFEPQLLATPEQRNLVTGIVVGVALGGLIIAWLVDQTIRWQAEQTAKRILAAANMEVDDRETGRLEFRHMLMLMGAFLAILGAAAALWLPDYYPWVRLGSAVITLIAVAIAIRYDWIQSVENAIRTVSAARRRAATAHLSAAQRKRIHEQVRADLAAEAQVALDHLEEAKQAAFRELRNRPLYTRIQRVQERMRTMLPQMQDLQQANATTQEADPERVARQQQAMQEEIQRCSELAQAVFWHVQQKEGEVAGERLDELEQSIQEMQSLLTRWQAVTV